MSVPIYTTWVQMVFPAIAKALNKFLASALASMWWFLWCLLLLSCMKTQAGTAPAEEYTVKLLDKNFCWTYTPYVAACELQGWRGSSREYLHLSFLICIPLIMAAWNCSVISSVVSASPEIITGQTWSEIYKNRVLKWRIATLKLIRD